MSPKERTVRARIAGKSWRLVFLPRRGDGECFIRRRLMEVRSSLRGKRLLETIIHEALHAAHWQIDDEYVHQTAEDIARLLWRLGFRERTEES